MQYSTIHLSKGSIPHQRALVTKESEIMGENLAYLNFKELRSIKESSDLSS